VELVNFHTWLAVCQGDKTHQLQPGDCSVAKVLSFAPFRDLAQQMPAAELCNRVTAVIQNTVNQLDKLSIIF
jgi:hypothetical protein